MGDHFESPDYREKSVTWTSNPDPARQEAFAAYGPIANIFNNQRIIAGADSAILNDYDQIDVASLMKQVRHLITDHLS